MANKMKRRVRRWTASAVILLLLVCGGVVLLRSLYPAHYAQEIHAAAEKYDLAPSLIMAVIHTESGFDPEARSSAGAIGLMQVTAPTMEWALMRSGVSDKPTVEALTEPTFNIEVGSCVLQLLGEQFSEQDTVLAAYNAGMGHVQTWLSQPDCSADGKTLHTIPFAETERYVKKVRRAQKIYQKLYGIS
ncbi:MAG: lytic transglycosylase domain-containing protein [Ruminococcaceae bacterium]|nr:lytic transglycosylase domain-containing protein [Oscillospiraceae bacterium]